MDFLLGFIVGAILALSYAKISAWQCLEEQIDFYKTTLRDKKEEIAELHRYYKQEIAELHSTIAALNYKP